MSSALEARFLTTGPPAKSSRMSLYVHLCVGEQGFLKDEFQEVEFAVGLEPSCSVTSVSFLPWHPLAQIGLPFHEGASPSSSVWRRLCCFQEVRVVGGGGWAFYKPPDRPRSIMHAPQKASTLSHSQQQLARGGWS